MYLKTLYKFWLLLLLLFINVHLCNQATAQNTQTPITFDFHNKQITDILATLGQYCNVSIITDDTVTGTATFCFADTDLQTALQRFAEHNRLFIEQRDGIYFITKSHIQYVNDKLSIEAENVPIEQMKP